MIEQIYWSYVPHFFSILPLGVSVQYSEFAGLLEFVPKTVLYIFLVGYMTNNCRISVYVLGIYIPFSYKFIL
jgi:hypothetical protein